MDTDIPTDMCKAICPSFFKVSKEGGIKIYRNCIKRSRNSKKILKTRHVFVKHGCPRRQQSQNMAKISKSYVLTPPHPQGHVMSVKCEEPIDELTVQVWLLYHHLNFKYCTLFVSGTELWTDKRTDRRTIRLLDAPTDLSGRGHQKTRQKFDNGMEPKVTILHPTYF